ncbi:hypothetical protein PANA5342_2259 [Pantoea ananatis LMG 5342]|nr:hypothetical protein PANA5342_2259 [Pantoea ananatis LMG 5342]
MFMEDAHSPGMSHLNVSSPAMTTLQRILSPVYTITISLK